MWDELERKNKQITRHHCKYTKSFSF